MGYTQWFEELLAEFGHELVVGDAAKIRAKEPRKQKHDRRDAAHLLNLLVKGDFPRLWLPSAAERDGGPICWLCARHGIAGLRNWTNASSRKWGNGPTPNAC